MEDQRPPAVLPELEEGGRRCEPRLGEDLLHLGAEHQPVRGGEREVSRSEAAEPVRPHDREQGDRDEEPGAGEGGGERPVADPG